MPLMMPGAESSESLVRISCGGSVPLTGATCVAAVFDLTPRGPAAWGGSDANIQIVNSVTDHARGLGLRVTGIGGVVNATVRCRTAIKNAYSYDIPLTSGLRTLIGFRADFVSQVIDIFVNGEKMDPPLVMEEGDSWVSSPLQPFVQSQVDPAKGMEWAEVAFWSNSSDPDPGSLDDLVPTIVQMESITAGAGFSASPPPQSHISPSGADGAYAGNFPDLAMSGQVWSQTAGPTTGDLAPYFVGPPAEVDVDAEATARTLNIEGTTSVSGGTVYVIVDTVANMPTPPDPEDVVGGLLADGVTAALDSTSQAMTGTTNLSVAFEPLPANTNLAYAIVHDRDDEGDYTEVIYGTVSTKRPVVVPAGEDPKWYKADGTERESETGVVLTILGTEYSESDLTTDANAEGEVDLTAYINGGGDLDIGDAVDFDLTFSDGEVLAARGLTITEGV